MLTAVSRTRRRWLTAALPLIAALAAPLQAGAVTPPVGTTSAVFPASTCTVYVNYTVDPATVPTYARLSDHATCGITGYGLWISFASLSAYDYPPVGGYTCEAGGYNDTYPVRSVSGSSCTTPNPTAGLHTISVYFDFDPHDTYYSPGCAQDTFYDPSYEDCNWSFQDLVQ